MKKRIVRTGSFERPKDAPVLSCTQGDLPCWKSQGGAAPRHIDRILPTSLTVEIPQGDGRLESIAVIGVFALHATADAEPPGVVGATIHLLDGEETVLRQDLVQGRHYSDATASGELYRLNGDGTSVETVGSVELDGQTFRLDRLALDVPGGTRADTLVFRDRGTPASFIVCDVLFEFEEVGECPFKGGHGHVALGEIGSILRLRDRSRLDLALHQMGEGIHACGSDLDEARGLALTFLAAVVGALLELEPQRAMHKEQLEAAREFEQLQDPTTIASAAVRRVRGLTDGIVKRTSRTGDATIDRALDLMSRGFTRDLDADSVARQLNLSTSHFRHLFRQATRQPFHKYLVSLRLEKARELLLQTDVSVTEIADTVGFLNSAHFSRAFSKRFGIAPSALRQNRR